MLEQRENVQMDHHMRIINLEKWYGRQRAFGPVSVDVGVGSLVVVTGDNGSGKTSLLRCICGLDKFDGQIVFPGADGRRPIMSAVFDDPAMPREIKVKWLLRMHHLAQVDLDKFGLERAVLAKRVANLSFGQRRRLALAIAFGRNPSVTVLDEPLVGVDESGQEVIIEHINDKISSGMAVIVTTHAPEVFASLPYESVHLGEGVKNKVKTIGLRRVLHAAYWESLYAIANRKAALTVVVAAIGALLVFSSTYSEFGVRLQDIDNMIEISRDTTAPLLDMVRDGDEMAVGVVREALTLRRASSPWGMMHAALDLASFILAPSLGAFMGHSVVAKWRTFGLMRQRSTEDGWPAMVGGAQIAGVVLGAVFVFALMVASALVGLIAKIVVDPQIVPGEALLEEGLVASSLSPIIPKVIFCWLVFSVFYLVGFALGHISPSALPLVLLIIALWVLPITAALDPRAVLAEQGRNVLDFQGGFVLGPTPEPSGVGQLLVVALVSWGVAFPFIAVGTRSRFR